MNMRKNARKLKADIPAVFLALQDKNTPVIAKLLAEITVCYALSPIDLIPDFIPVLGYLDDLILLPMLVAVTIKCIPKDIWEKSKEKSEGMWQDGKPKKWYYAVPVLFCWMFQRASNKKGGIFFRGGCKGGCVVRGLRERGVGFVCFHSRGIEMDMGKR